MKNRWVWILAFGLMISGSILAMPDEDDLTKLERGVAAIVADIEKREKRDWEKIAEELLALEGDVAGIPEKFLFKRESVLCYLRSGKCEKAQGLLSQFVSEEDVASVLAIDEYVKKKITPKEQASLRHSGTYAEYDQFVRNIISAHREEVALANRLSGLEAAYAKDPSNVRLRNQLAKEYTLHGIWEKAVPLLALLKGQIGDAARAEEKNPDAKGAAAIAIADGWWNVEGKVYSKEMTVLCQRHAAEWYRAALADDALASLERIRIGGRIEQAESGDKEHLPSVVAKKGNHNEGFPNVSVKGGECVKVALDARGKQLYELAVCPPGEFTMDSGRAARCWREHRVRLTYPYLIGCGHVTFGMVRAIDRKMWKKRMDRIRTEDEKFYSDDMYFNGITDSELASFLKKIECNC